MYQCKSKFKKQKKNIILIYLYKKKHNHYPLSNSSNIIFFIVIELFLKCVFLKKNFKWFIFYFLKFIFDITNKKN